MIKRLMAIAMDFPKATVIVIVGLSLLVGSQLLRIKIDTDPENMLSSDQPDRVLYNQIKQDFAISDLIVFGLTDESGVYQPAILQQFAALIDGILNIPGVVTDDVISLTTTNNVQAMDGLLEVRRIMQQVPQTEAELRALREAIAGNPLLSEKVASVDGNGLAVYIPIISKDQAQQIGDSITDLVEPTLKDGQRFYLAGLPIAEDRFGAEMFLQMGIMAPLSGMLIFALLWLMFRQFALIIPVMIVAMLTVMWGMGLLVGMGYTVHIMASMIPVFLMPIAVLDAVHILSEFYDRYPKLQDRRQALEQTLDELSTPMMFTTLTSAVGFAALLLADIPPVQVFGAFVAVGIVIAWVLTITFIPACIMLLKESTLRSSVSLSTSQYHRFDSVLSALGSVAHKRALPIGIVSLVLLLLGAVGITRSEVNDNPVNWFAKNHEIRVADRAMNRLFGGTYMAYVVLEGADNDVIKQPDVMNYIDALQKHISADPAVGKTSSLIDIVRQINYVLHDNDPTAQTVPESVDEIAQYLFLYQLSGDVGDLDNFVDYDYRQISIWVQMQSGQNQDMARLKASVDEFITLQPLPAGLSLHWSGLNYINKVWQDLMVSGMLQAMISSFLAVLIIMTLLMRSVTLGVLSILPLTLAIVLAYGLAGFVGKDYDMPIAVCSSLALGLSIDFAIHFIHRYRRFTERYDGNLISVNAAMFDEPARAIVRNAIVIAIGFLPMVLSSLSPYKIVGIFFAILMIVSALSSLLLLPGLLRATHGRKWAGFGWSASPLLLRR